MNGRISAALVAMGAMILFAGSASDRAGAQTPSRQTELSTTNVQDDHQDSKANSRMEFILAEPFTFARPPVTNAPQGQ
jgi:hypothetical protein